MSRSAKVGFVCGGYLLAFGAAALASHLYNLRVAEFPEDTSGGMYAAGEVLSGLAAFLVVALIPTLLALWFLRHHRILWLAIACGALAFAAAGLIAILMRPGALATTNVAIMAAELLAVVQLLGVPLWTIAFVLFALIAPTRPARKLLIAAVGVELAIAVCAAIHWFVPRQPI
jgi:hypothetical protein